MMKRAIYFLFFITILTVSCNDFLEEKPDKSLLIPNTLMDFQKLLDNMRVFNVTPAAGLIGSDNFYTTDNGWETLIPLERNYYLWAVDLYEGSNFVPDWITSYEQVYYANVIVDGVVGLEIEPGVQSQWNQVKASALFYRALAFYNIAQLFASPYDKNTATKTPGILIRLNANVNETTGRGTLQQTYDQITRDLLEAACLLPITNAYNSRPSKIAAQALLARVYLTMENYEKAIIYADSCLKANGTLMDYNSLDPNNGRPLAEPLPEGNDEVIFHSLLANYRFLGASSTIVDSTLYELYHENDLRKSLFFIDRGNGVINFRGSYSESILGNNAAFFGGLATDEMYLIRAECNARKGSASAAMSDLNTLLAKRYLKDTFIPIAANDSNEALKKVLDERRKELIGRGMRWTDLRRLNKDSQFQRTLKRILDGQEYILSPGDHRYVLPFPGNEITDDILQNPR